MMIVSIGLFLHELARPGNTGPHGGYWFWSGLGSDFSEVTLLGVVLVLLRKHNCHEQGCWRLQFKPHPDDPDHIVCRRHHSAATRY